MGKQFDLGKVILHEYTTSRKSICDRGPLHPPDGSYKVPGGLPADPPTTGTTEKLVESFGRNVDVLFLATFTSVDNYQVYRLSFICDSQRLALRWCDTASHHADDGRLSLTRQSHFLVAYSSFVGIIGRRRGIREESYIHRSVERSLFGLAIVRSEPSTGI
jgi:hypothetical protein